MPKDLHLELTTNCYQIFWCVYSYCIILLALTLIAMPWWLYWLALGCCSVGFLPTLIQQLVPCRKIKNLDVRFDQHNQLVMTLPHNNHQPLRWNIRWRSRRLIVISFWFSYIHMPIVIWISPHSLQHPKQHRLLRIMTCFHPSSTQQQYN